MSDRLASKYDSFIALYREQAVPVFRYHLLRSGDWQEAESWTKETFQRAWLWFKQRDEQSTKVWLYRIAVSIHSGVRRAPAEMAAVENPISPTQEQLGAFARVTELHEAWRRRARKLFDAFGLFLLTGLDVDEVGQVVGWDPLQTQERIGRLVSENQELRLIVNTLDPVGFFVQRLERELQEFIEQKRGAKVRLSGPAAWWWQYKLGPVLTALSQVLTVLLLAGLFMLAVGFFQPSDATPNNVQPTASRPNLGQQGMDGPPLTILENSQDRVLLVNESGAIVLLDLADSSTRAITPDAFMPVGPIDPRYPAHLTPDGEWLVLVRPGGAATWLIPLNGEERQIIWDEPVRPAWSPDGGEAVYPLPENPRILYHYDVASASYDELIRLPGEARWVAWSPDGRMLGVVYTQPGDKPNQQITTIAVLDSSGRRRVTLASTTVTIREDDSLLDANLHRLLWTPDSSELWYPRWQLAYPVDESMASELAADQSDFPVGQVLAVQPRMLTAQALSDPNGVQSLLLFGGDVFRYGETLSPVISPDRNLVALAFRNPDGSLGTLAVRLSSGFDHLFIENFGSVGKMSWTQEGRSLIVAEAANQPGSVSVVDAATGEQSLLVDNAWLIGTVSELTERGRALAPQTVKMPLIGPDFTGPRVELTQAGMDIHLSVPSHWQVWLGNPQDNDKTMVISNFAFGDPTGWTSLNADDIVVAIYQFDIQNDAAFSRLIDERRADATVRSVERVSVGGREAYNIHWQSPGRSDFRTVYINGHTQAYVVLYYPVDSTRIPVVKEMLDSIWFDDDDSADPSISLRNRLRTQWFTYIYYDLGIEFQLPVGLHPGVECGLVVEEGYAQIGSRIMISKNPLSEASLREHVETLAAMNGNRWQLSKFEEVDVGGQPGILLEGSQDVSGFFSMTFVERDGSVLLVNYSPRGTCRLPADGVSELEVYHRITQSLEFIEQ